ncbi:glycerol-3-phosphate dehydrogenase/oxidase [Bacillus sp. AFS041924]|uniref:glycerol-3-phosphate dehydrogenase/oxidase n=1 Tax=Bacillus sp. AFS041924 TaxID=2033503 RepID=UPI000BFB4576|nr:glycerol-3-phosphate dehydrogenase/oxidase [Bacillus sp. AFS041924]PGS55816.1 glycerol-3-phosphate dehydrogenase [Bacillus sp. AFS041924]
MEEQFSCLNRRMIKKRLAEKEFDVLVIGGGITGCGIALDAVTRGMSTALVEMQDFAAGTSSRSTKLVHGGLRYLKQYEFKMVAEVGKERGIVYENGPHVTTPEWMLLPIYKGGTFGKFTTSIGLRLYDYLAGVKKDERRKILNRKETIKKEPLVKREGLIGGGYYVEYRTDDARLTIEVIKKAVEYGALAINYVKMTDFIYENNKMVGAKVIDLITRVPFTIRAKKIINATGPWVDQLRGMERLESDENLRLTKGVHLVIDHKKFPLNQSVYFDTIDGRMVFAIPRDGKTYVGTTDTFFDRDTANPNVSNEDRQYILNCIKYMFPTINLEDIDIESSWAGVRPLIFEKGKDPSEISRKDEIWESSSGLISIAGGKLTGYRKMAETIVDLLSKNSDNRLKECQTKNLPISGGDVGGSKGFHYFKKRFSSVGVAIGLSESEYKRLSKIYGSNIEHLMNISFSDFRNYTKLPLSLFLQLEYSIQNEMTVKPVDFFIRRTGFLYFQIDLVKKYKDEVIRYMANRLSWNKYQIEEYRLELEEKIKDAVTAYNE